MLGRVSSEGICDVRIWESLTEVICRFRRANAIIAPNLVDLLLFDQIPISREEPVVREVMILNASKRQRELGALPPSLPAPEHTQTDQLPRSSTCSHYT